MVSGIPREEESVRPRCSQAFVQTSWTRVRAVRSGVRFAIELRGRWRQSAISGRRRQNSFVGSVSTVRPGEIVMVRSAGPDSFRPPAISASAPTTMTNRIAGEARAVRGRLMPNDTAPIRRCRRSKTQRLPSHLKPHPADRQDTQRTTRPRPSATLSGMTSAGGHARPLRQQPAIPSGANGSTVRPSANRDRQPPGVVRAGGHGAGECRRPGSSTMSIIRLSIRRAIPDWFRCS